MFETDDCKKRKSDNDRHLETPISGDYWHEMFIPICLVIDVKDDVVILCKETIEVGDGLEFNIKQLESRTLAEFRASLEYGNIPGTSADVIPSKGKIDIDPDAVITPYVKPSITYKLTVEYELSSDDIPDASNSNHVKTAISNDPSILDSGRITQIRARTVQSS